MIIRSLVRFSTIVSLAAMVVWGVIAAVPAMADGVTFAQYIEVNALDQQWSFSAAGGVTTITGSGSVDFTFSGVPGSPDGALPADFVFSATSSTGGTTNNNAYSEAGFSGSFSFTDTALAVGMQNLLSGTFQATGTGAQFNESIGGTGGGFGASDTASDPNEVILTSNYINFMGQTLQTSTFTYSSLNPTGFTAGGTPDFPTGGPYTAAGDGTFSSEPGFEAPEPATLNLVGGALLLGVGMFRRKKVVRT